MTPLPHGMASLFLCFDRWFRILPNNFSRHSRTVCVFFFSPRGRRGTLLTQDAKCVAGVALRDIEHFTFQSNAARVVQKCRPSRTVSPFSVGGRQGTALHRSRASCGASKRVAGVAHRDMHRLRQFSRTSVDASKWSPLSHLFRFFVPRA